jgi:hypothetical protein
MIPRTDETYYNTIVVNQQQGAIMIPLTQITWEYISRRGEERRGRKTKTIYLNVIHIFKMEEQEYGTRVYYAIHGDVLVEETPQQISELILQEHKNRNKITSV